MTSPFEVTSLVAAGALLVGAGVGVLTGMFGVGGGFLITPLLSVLLGVPMPIAVGTGAMQILGTTTAGLYRRRHEGRVDYKMALVLFGGNYVGVRLGDAVIQWLKGLGDLTINGESVSAVDFVIQVVFVAILSAIAAWLVYDTARKRGNDEATEGLFSHLPVPPLTAFSSLGGRQLSVPVMSYFGLAVGFFTGLLGIGGGVILVPALLYLVGMSAHCSSATSLAMVWLSSLAAVITKTPSGDASLALVIPLLIGGTAGLQLGITICNRMSGASLKKYFALVVTAAMVLVLTDLVGYYV